MDSEMWTSDTLQTLQAMLTVLQEKTWWNDYASIVAKIQKIQNQIFKEIDDWNYCLQLAQVGWPLPSSLQLDDLQPLCDNLARVLFTISQQIQQQMRLNHGHAESLKLVNDHSKAMIGAFLKRCLVIEKQPPHFIVKGTQFKVYLRLLVNSLVFSAHGQDPPKVSCSIHLDQKGHVHCTSEEISPKMENNEEMFKQDGKVFKVTLDKIKVLNSKPDPKNSTKRTRSGRSASEPVTHVPEWKSHLLFQTQVSIESETFLLEAFSVPVVVITNTSQQRDAEATIFWDNAFGAQNRQPFDEPNEVPFPKFAEALRYRWGKWNEKELSEKQLIFLARKLFPGREITNNLKVEDLQNCMVTKLMLHKNNLNGHPFTFWKWFYETMKFVKDCLKSEWRDGLIEGFINYNDAEQSVQSQAVGTFMLRFSESLLGGISVAYKKSSGECTSVLPLTKSDLDKIPLSKCIREAQQLSTLYPSIPKETVFLESLEIPKVAKTRYPVKKRMRFEIDDGCSSSSSPSQSSLSVPDDFTTSDQASMASEEPFSPFSTLDSDPFFGEANVQCSMDDIFNSFQSY